LDGIFPTKGVEANIEYLVECRKSIHENKINFNTTKELYEVASGIYMRNFVRHMFDTSNTFHDKVVDYKQINKSALIPD